MKANLFHTFLTIIAGLILFFSFTPYNQPLFALVAIAIYFYVLLHCNSKKAFLLGLLLGVIYCSNAVSWLFISFYFVHQLSFWPVFLVMLLSNLYLGAYYALMSFIFVVISRNCNLAIKALQLSALWMLFEWLRSLLLTGFPWLLLGYSQIDYPVSYLAPIVGVYGVGFVTVLCACLLTITAINLRENKTQCAVLSTLLLLLYLGPYALSAVQWTKPVNGQTLDVTVLQANKAVNQKVNLLTLFELMSFYLNKTEESKSQLIVWPESSLPYHKHQFKTLLQRMNKELLSKKQGLLLGIHRADADSKEYNTIIALGEAHGIYKKRRLAPYGEYLPWAWINTYFFKFQLPQYNISPGSEYQELIAFMNLKIASYICYEVAFFELVRKQIGQANFIVSTNDYGWLGKSFAMQQHVEMARMLSLQTGMYQVIANNSGYSSVIDHKGNIATQLAADSKGVLNARILPRAGVTPWSKSGDKTLIVLFLIIILIFQLIKRTYNE